MRQKDHLFGIPFIKLYMCILCGNFAPISTRITLTTCHRGSRNRGQPRHHRNRSQPECFRDKAAWTYLPRYLRGECGWGIAISLSTRPCLLPDKCHKVSRLQSTQSLFVANSAVVRGKDDRRRTHNVGIGASTGLVS